MVDIATSLHAQLTRAAEKIADIVAVEGLIALKRTLDQAGFPKHSSGKDPYEIRSNVTSEGIWFEIVVDSDMVVAADERTKDYIRAQIDENVEKAGMIFRTYVMTEEGPQRRDARQTSLDRAVQRGISIRSPRSMEMTEDGKFRVALDKIKREGAFDVSIPPGYFQGVLQGYEKKMYDTVEKAFVPELSRILRNGFP